MNSNQPIDMIETYLKSILMLVQHSKENSPEDTLHGLILRESLLNSLRDKISIACDDINRLMEQALGSQLPE